MARPAAGILRTSLAALALAACGSQPADRDPLPFPTPFPEITTTPTFQVWVSDQVRRFRTESAEALPLGFGLEIQPLEQAQQSVEDGAYQLLISSAEPPEGWFVTPLGWEAVAFVVHPENRVRRLHSEQLRSVFSGQIWNWDELGGSSIEIEAVIPLPGDELRDYLQRELLGGRPFTPAALLGPTPELMLSLLAARPGAIGILPLSAVSGQARPLLVDGAAAETAALDDGTYPYRVEILAFAPDEPVGQVREWLVWLQGQN